MEAYTFNLSTQAVEMGWVLWIQGQDGLHSEFQDMVDYTERPSLKRRGEIRETEKERGESGEKYGRREEEEGKWEKFYLHCQK